MRAQRTVLVTGAGGFLGRHVAHEFLDAGWTVVGTDRVPCPPTLEQALDAYHELTLPGASLDSVFERHAPHVCIHCAGGASVEASLRDPEADFLAGPVVTFELLETVRRLAPQCRVVLLSSAAVYGNPEVLPVAESQAPAPLSPYGFHKLQCEALLAEYHRVYEVPTSSARIFSAYGEGLRKQVLWDISCAALDGGRLVLRGTGNESRDFVHGRDVAHGLRIIAERGAMNAAVYNLASGKETTIRALASRLIEALGVAPQVEFDGRVPRGTPLNWRADIGRLEALGYRARVSLAEGVAAYGAWRLTERSR